VREGPLLGEERLAVTTVSADVNLAFIERSWAAIDYLDKHRPNIYRTDYEPQPKRITEEGDQ